MRKMPDAMMELRREGGVAVKKDVTES